MGEIPGEGNMVGAIFTSPKNNDVIQADQTFTITVQVANLNAGSFTNPDNTYYAAPQQLQNGNIVGHTHVTVQKIENENAPPETNAFDFFKGINDNGNGQGGLSAEVQGGLPEGNYRVCSLNSASNHAPVVMPVSPFFEAFLPTSAELNLGCATWCCRRLCSFHRLQRCW